MGDLAKERGIGLDFNPTLFSHDMVKDNLTLSHPDETVRAFWVRHCQCCFRIAQYFAEELGQPCVMNIWIPDGIRIFLPTVWGRARVSPSRSMRSCPFRMTAPSAGIARIEGVRHWDGIVYRRFFGIYRELRRFPQNFAADGQWALSPDGGGVGQNFAMLLFFDQIALHVTRPVRWDSDHVVLFDDETRELAKEIVRNDALDRVKVGLDFFDASINRVAAWTIGMRNFQKALLYALLTPHELLKRLQEENRFTELMMRQEELKTYPFGAVWDQFCAQNGAPVGEAWYTVVKTYEEEVLSKRC